MTRQRLAIHAVFRVAVALGRAKARWDRFWWRVSPQPRRCSHRGCGRDWFDTWVGTPYCRVHHPEHEVPIGSEVVRRVPWVDDGRGQTAVDDWLGVFLLAFLGLVAAVSALSLVVIGLL